METNTNKKLNEANGNRVIPERLTHENSVLILIDYLTELMLACRSIDQQLLRNNTLALAKLGAALDIPTIMLGDEGTLNGPFMPEVKQVAHPDTLEIPRHTPSAMDEPAFVAAIEKTGRRNLIMAGITTDNCVALTALDAQRAGFQVTIVVDASGTFNSFIEQTAMLRLSQAGIAVVTWAALASELARDWKRPTSGEVIKIYHEHAGELANMMNNLAYYNPEKAASGGK